MSNTCGECAHPLYYANEQLRAEVARLTARLADLDHSMDRACHERDEAQSAADDLRADVARVSAAADKVRAALSRLADACDTHVPETLGAVDGEPPDYGWPSEMEKAVNEARAVLVGIKEEK